MHTRFVFCILTYWCLLASGCDQSPRLNGSSTEALSASVRQLSDDDQQAIARAMARIAVGRIRSGTAGEPNAEPVWMLQEVDGLTVAEVVARGDAVQVSPMAEAMLESAIERSTRTAKRLRDRAKR